MTFDAFMDLSGFTKKLETERVRLLAFYLAQVKDQKYFTLKEVCDTFYTYGFTKPNTARLKDNMLDSKKFVRGEDTGTFRLRKTEMDALKVEFPLVDSKSEEIVTDDTILPESLYHGTRGYIVKLAQQINGCYNNRFYDGCAMLMRRLLELLLVKTYEHLGRRSEIEEGDGLKQLSFIINHTLSNKVVLFHKDSIEVLDDFRGLGNLSAHRIEFNAKRTEIRKVQLEYRAIVEKLLYDSGIRK
jgi:hypothetical protein